ncbi:enoyl-CoA hydratase/isomerase family protein [Nonomuraea mesophila]|uniref:enoyl-CoA hydratase/isomerase family protein n=1 Tax=Nonomuraea mesophila TaxID=2530382 RepID=UPI001C700C7C|nr:enoyl-CoA hydratase/isomerase family protein [Nonomuraea mesophila]
MASGISRRSEAVRVEIDSGVGVVTLTRPDRLNALTHALLRDLRDAVTGIGARADVGAVVLAGQGRAFCAGLDLAEGLADPSPADPVESMHSGMRAGAAVTAAIRDIPQPVIAAVQGYAVGAGFAFAAAADVRIVSPDAKFSAPFLRLGMTAGDFGLSWLLPRLIGHGRAASLIYAAGRLDAGQALEYGLASAIEADPLAAARQLAAEIAAYPSYGVQATKRLLDSAAESPLAAHLEAEARAQTIGALSDAAREAFATALAATKKPAKP